MKKAVLSPDFSWEISLNKEGYRLIAGVDEVGRGAIAGPIVAAAVIFNDYEKIILELTEINDSKILTAKKRLTLNLIIKEYAHSYSFGVVDPEEIDSIGIGAANILAFKRALDKLVVCDFALIDGREFHGFDYKHKCLEKGESKSISIAAASIIAKVYRDELMENYPKDFDLYDFRHNKGYGTREHFSSIDSNGITKVHRKTFLNKYHVNRESLKLF